MAMAKEDEVTDEIQIAVFHLGTEEFGVGIKQVKEIIKMVEPTKMPNSPAHVEGVINLRGEIITIIDLRKRLAMPVTETGDQTRIIIVEDKGTIVGMIVDSVTEVLRLSLGDIEPTPSISTDVDADYIMGVGKIKSDEKDRLLILLDLGKIVLA